MLPASGGRYPERGGSLVLRWVPFGGGGLHGLARLCVVGEHVGEEHLIMLDTGLGGSRLGRRDS